VTSEAAAYLDKARELLTQAVAMLGIHLNEAAGRTAYLAAFHSAQAFIFECTGRALKSHQGVHTEFLRLTKDDRRLEPELRIFLSQSYHLKAIADYETGPDAKVSADRAAEVVAIATRLVARITEIIASIGSNSVA
jgi:uncharacterized protein (UPF0332 family)